jgi:transaldolase/glucose-6-phosphate isomerase
MKYNPLLKIQDFGQSIWLDYLRRDMLESGGLKQLIDNDGLRGITSNPKIFWKAIDGSGDYTTAIKALADQHKSKEEIYRELTVEDVQDAADQLRPVYDTLNGRDGFVSLEVNPHLARDVDHTLKEALDLWRALDRPNVYIKVPATVEGLRSIRTLISEGINVNVTLLFGLDRYREVADAYLSGVEDRLKRGLSIEGISSVASFFLSRIDVKVDPELDKIKKEGGEIGKIADSLRGETAISCAKIAYQIYKEIFKSDRFRKLEEHGAHPQRVLWASTSTKDPAYSDVKYVEPLIGPNSVNTVPQETLNAYRDHGNPAPRLEEDIDKARSVLDRLEEVGIDIEQVTEELVKEGIEKFNKPYDQTMGLLEKYTGETASRIDSQEMLLGEYEESVFDRIEKLARIPFSTQLWQKDPELWSNEKGDLKQIKNSLGWLHVPEKMISNVPNLLRFATDIQKDGVRHVVHLGMGGSSLAPLVFQQVFPTGKQGLPLAVLDTTDPDTVLEIEREIPLKDTLFIVASKSGTTAETMAFMEYFYDRVKRSKKGNPGDNFVAITDPGSPLTKKATEYGFRETFCNYPDIGGRYSALSFFGMVPAALMDIDIEQILERALRMAQSSQSDNAVAHNPGIALGAAIGELARQGRDKLTFLTSPSVSSFGMWLEQLLAESTGKNGTGILPVAGETIGDPSDYGSDRIFVYFELQDEKYDKTLQQVKRLADSGHPVIIIRLADRYDIGQEMMRWEIATATAGKVLGINPFDQPNVQESKDITNELLRAVAKKGPHFLAENVGSKEDGIEYVDAANESRLQDALSSFLDRVKVKDYVDIQAYLPESEETDLALQDIRLDIRSHLKTATTVGYGPRYLHSTGQYHKGGPNSGLFIQLLADSDHDAEIPGKPYSFATFREAQARGDLEALRKHGRRVIRINLGTNAESGLNRLRRVLIQPVMHQG